APWDGARMARCVRSLASCPGDPAAPRCQGRTTVMHRHGPTCLQGPVSRGRRRWPAPEAAEVRQELVRRVRREIEAGVYDTPERWEAALERLWRRLNWG